MLLLQSKLVRVKGKGKTTMETFFKLDDSASQNIFLEMEGHLENSPKQGYPAYREDENVEKCVLGLGTTLVATFEEAKERISQIEHIFCSQIFPTFQLKSENLQNFFPEGKKAREDACKEKENDLILPIERLQCEKQQALEENQSLKLEWGTCQN
ncbi:protein gamma response 1 [Quercus suber]|uniref:Protein gamma response 1 n=1 Tax=Quercus suber TaxID=58331 RepID=A0AAW0L9D3_QUESU